jgi:hypothetical protein
VSLDGRPLVIDRSNAATAMADAMDVLYGSGDQGLSALLRVKDSVRTTFPMDLQPNLVVPCPGGGTARRITAVMTELDLETSDCILQPGTVNGRIVVRPVPVPAGDFGQDSAVVTLADRLSMQATNDSTTFRWTGDLSQSQTVFTRSITDEKKATEMSLAQVTQARTREFRLRDYASRFVQFPVGASQTRNAAVETRNPKLGPGTLTYTLSLSGPDAITVMVTGSRSAAQLVISPSGKRWTPADTTRLFRLRLDSDGDGVFEVDLGDISYADLLALM